MVTHQGRVFSHHEIESRVEAEELGSWLLKRPGDSSFWCRITAASGKLVVVGDIDSIVFGYGPLIPRDLVKWIGSCPDGDTYYPSQKAEIGMRIRIVKRRGANGIRPEAVLLAHAAVRRLHALLEHEVADPKLPCADKPLSKTAQARLQLTVAEVRAGAYLTSAAAIGQQLAGRVVSRVDLDPVRCDDGDTPPDEPLANKPLRRECEVEKCIGWASRKHGEGRRCYAHRDPKWTKTATVLRYAERQKRRRIWSDAT